MARPIRMKKHLKGKITGSWQWIVDHLFLGVYLLSREGKSQTGFREAIARMERNQAVGHKQESPKKRPTGPLLPKDYLDACLVIDGSLLSPFPFLLMRHYLSGIRFLVLS